MICRHYTVICCTVYILGLVKLAQTVSVNGTSSGILLFHSRSMTPITWQAAVDDKEQRPLL